MIHAFHFASVSKQLICRDLNIFKKSNRKIFKSNLDLLNRIFLVQIDISKSVQIAILIPFVIGTRPSLPPTEDMWSENVHNFKDTQARSPRRVLSRPQADPDFLKQHRTTVT